MANFKEELTNIKAFIFDVDGVFSGNIFLSASGEQHRTMNIKDGYAVQLAAKKGIPIAIITGGYSEGIRIRFEGLGIKPEDIYMRSAKKLDNYLDFISRYNLNPETIMYMGDDLPDYEVMKRIGVAVCPLDSAEEIKAISKYISHQKGGEGCVRDVIEQVLRAQGKWMDTDAFNW